jgi:tetratricopeptide (TPR) repeat protein
VRLVLALSLGLAGAALAGPPPGTTASRTAIALCEDAGRAPAAEQLARFEAALAAAEAAVAEDDGDALAHFAVFCGLGGRMQRQGLGPGALLGLVRLRREVDRTIELAPDYADALAGKGALLLDAPRLLGGDPLAAEAFFRKAIALEPDYLMPRFNLARALLRRGARDEARLETRRALRIARHRDDDAAAAQGRALLAEIDPPARDGG